MRRTTKRRHVGLSATIWYKQGYIWQSLGAIFLLWARNEWWRNFPKVTALGYDGVSKHRQIDYMVIRLCRSTERRHQSSELWFNPDLTLTLTTPNYYYICWIWYSRKHFQAMTSPWIAQIHLFYLIHLIILILHTHTHIYIYILYEYLENFAEWHISIT